jgi:hypothetical protein
MDIIGVPANRDPAAQLETQCHVSRVSWIGRNLPKVDGAASQDEVASPNVTPTARSVPLTSTVTSTDRSGLGIDGLLCHGFPATLSDAAFFNSD